jgi:hypothetical protein
MAFAAGGDQHVHPQVHPQILDGSAQRNRYRAVVPELSPKLTQRLIAILDGTLTLRRGVADRVTELSIVLTTGWHSDAPDAADRELLARHVLGGPDDEGWHTAQVAALHGHLVDLSEPDVLDQADEISAVTLAIAGRLYPDGDTVLALQDADWFTPFDSAALTEAGVALLDHMLARLCDRLAYLPGEHVRLVEPDDAEPPALERPAHWWAARGWTEIDDGIMVRPCGGS